jgi:hypothetical protein
MAAASHQARAAPRTMAGHCHHRRTEKQFDPVPDHHLMQSQDREVPRTSPVVHRTVKRPPIRLAAIPDLASRQM